MSNLPVVPSDIVVHLGAPDSNAENVRVSFTDYIKNVASSEIYPTWPESAIRANILAQVSFALNRVYTEWYRSQGYNFDITSSTSFDQKFIMNRDIFDNISMIVDDVFNDYVVRQGDINPLFTQYCDGKQVTCAGLSQWGTVDLAKRGLNPYEILQNYYGDDINIVFNAPIQSVVESYPGIPLKIGNAGEDVRTIQRQLNRIAGNYSAIPKIPQTNGVYNVQTESAVRAFQEIFDLDPDGIVGKATWYKIKRIYVSVKSLGELVSEGVSAEEADTAFESQLQLGSSGQSVKVLQYYLSVIGYFNDKIPQVSLDGVFGEGTQSAVRAFQKSAGLSPDGIVGRDTWNAIVNEYNKIKNTLPNLFEDTAESLYPGRFLSIGVQGDDVATLQKFIKEIKKIYPELPTIEVTGVYDDKTASAVSIIQSKNGIPVSGMTGPITWEKIYNLYKQARE